MGAKVPGTKILGIVAPEERKFHGAKVLETIASRERKIHGSKSSCVDFSVPGIKVPRNEKSRYCSHPQFAILVCILPV